MHDDSEYAYLFDTAKFEQTYRLARAMAASSLTPKHLREDKGGPFEIETVAANCFQVINQAMCWGFNPFALMKESYVVAGNLGWQGKVVAAVINARAGLKNNLAFEFNDKKGDDRMVTVIGTLRGEQEPRTVTLTVGQAKTSNDIWLKDPEQKLCYSGAIKWARRHCPEVALGVLTDDDIDKIVASQAKPAHAKIVEKPRFEVPQSLPQSAGKSPAELADEQIIQDYKDSLPEGHPDK